MPNESRSPVSGHLPVPATSARLGPLRSAEAHAGPDWPWQDARKMPDEGDEAIDLLELGRTVAKRRGLLLSMAIAGLVAALLVSFIPAPSYRASTTLQIEKRAPSVVKFDLDLNPGLDLDDRSGMGTQLQLLKSRVLAERVIDSLQLKPENRQAGQPAAAGDDRPLDAGVASSGQAWWARVRGNWGKVFGPAVASQQRLEREETLDLLERTMRAEQVRNSSIIKVSVENPDPQRAADIANAFAQGFIALNLERRLEASSYAKTFLDQQLASAKSRLEESERRLTQYARNRNILTLDEKTSALNQTFIEYSTALVKAEQERIKIESEHQSIRGAPDTARQVLGSPTIQDYKRQRSKLDAELQLNSKIYKDGFPVMVQLRAQIADIDAKIRAEVASILHSVGNQLEMARRQEAQVKTRLQQTRQEIVRGQDRLVDYNLLKREVDTSRELYGGLLQQAREVGVAGGVQTNNIQVVDKAEAPLFPHQPMIALNAAIGLLAGLVLGLVLALLKESLDDSIQLSDEVDKALMLPLLGVIPQASRPESLSSLALLAHTDRRGHLAEAYRSARTALQFSSPTGAPRRLVVTSTTKNEGKSTTALALAISFAQLGSKVLLVDADMRNPSTHKLLRMGNDHGLSNFLAGQQSDAPLVRDAEIPNLSLMTAGPIPPNPVDLLMGPRFGELLDDLQASGHEFIIVDGPPVLGLADAIVLGRQVPAVLYVAQASQTRKSHIKDALRRLRLAGIVPLGVVLTKATAQNTAYYTDQNYYGYGSAETVGRRADPALNNG